MNETISRLELSIPGQIDLLVASSFWVLQF